MSDLTYILARIEDGARIKLALDYFGQPVALVPRRWLPGVRKIKLSPSDADTVEGALRARRARRRLPQQGTAATS